MNTNPPRFEAMNTGALLDRAFRLYGSNLSLMLGIVAVSHVPVYLIQLGSTYLATQGTRQQAAAVAALGSLLFLIIWGLIAYPLALGAGTVAVSECYLGREIGIGQAYRQALRRWGTILNTQLSVGLRVIGGYLLLVIPGIVLTCTYAVAIPVVMIEGAGALGAIQRSRFLSQDLRRSVFNILATLAVLNWVLLVAARMITLSVFDPHTATGVLAAQLSSDLVSIALIPLGVISPILLYYDFRIRKEGFDLEMLNQALAAQAGAIPAPAASA